MKRKPLAIRVLFLIVSGVVLGWLLFECSFRKGSPTREEAVIRNSMGNIQQLAMACSIYRQEYGSYPDRWGRLLDTGKIPLGDAKYFLSCRLNDQTLRIKRTQDGFHVMGSPFRLVLEEEVLSPESAFPLIQGTFGIALQLIAYSNTEVRCYEDGELRTIKERANPPWGLRQ